MWELLFELCDDALTDDLTRSCVDILIRVVVIPIEEIPFREMLSESIDKCPIARAILTRDKYISLLVSLKSATIRLGIDGDDRSLSNV